jgi:hypothetical protein
VLQVVFNRVIGNGRCYGIEMNVETTTEMRISRQPSPNTDYNRSKTVEKVEYLN